VRTWKLFLNQLYEAVLITRCYKRKSLVSSVCILPMESLDAFHVRAQIV
jgi:hypothetical protein